MRFRIVRHAIVDSTSERALQAVSDGTARHGDVHVATGQTAGRGRLGRRWESPVQEGLYASIVLLPPRLVQHPATLTMAAGLTMVDVIRGLAVPGVALKWPNDVEAGGAKLCGILVESRGQPPGAPGYVVGIGVNVAQTSFPRELAAERAVTSLALLGIELSVEKVLRRLLEALPPRLELAFRSSEELARQYLDATGLDGRGVCVRKGEETILGLLEGLSIDQGLRIRTKSGVLDLPLEHVSALTTR